MTLAMNDPVTAGLPTRPIAPLPQMPLRLRSCSGAKLIVS